EPLDRRLLSELERPAWDSVAKALVACFSNPLIDSAVAALPPEFNRAAMAELGSRLKRRRDQLPDVAAAFYRQLAEAVDVRGTKGDDRLTIEAGSDRSVTVTLVRAGAIAPWRRRFNPNETHEIRINLLDGNDRVEGSSDEPSIRTRVIHGSGEL